MQPFPPDHLRELLPEAQLRAESGAVLCRRAVLKGGLILGAAAWLTGCAGRSREVTTDLPGPVWPGPQPEYPVSPPPPTPTPAPRPTTRIASGWNGSIIGRSQWTRAGVARPSEINPMGRISRITIYHDAIPSQGLRSTGSVASRIESIRQAHIRNGWADIGYHYVIDPEGRVWEARGTRFQGAHVKDNNENNLGIVNLGNFDQQRPTNAQIATLDRFVAAQMRQYGVPMTRVFTHREINPTACPGQNLQAYMVQTRGSRGNLASIARA